MRIMSFNANRANALRADEVMEQLRSRGGERIVCLQEVPTWGEGTVINSAGVYSSKGCPTAVVVPTRLESNVTGYSFSDTCTTVRFGTVGVVSAYLADSGKGMEEYVRTIGVLRTDLLQARRAGVRHVVVGWMGRQSCLGMCGL